MISALGRYRTGEEVCDRINQKTCLVAIHLATKPLKHKQVRVSLGCYLLARNAIAPLGRYRTCEEVSDNNNQKTCLVAVNLVT